MNVVAYIIQALLGFFILFIFLTTSWRRDEATGALQIIAICIAIIFVLGLFQEQNKTK